MSDCQNHQNQIVEYFFPVTSHNEECVSIKMKQFASDHVLELQVLPVPTWVSSWLRVYPNSGWMDVFLIAFNIVECLWNKMDPAITQNSSKQSFFHLFLKMEKM